MSIDTTNYLQNNSGKAKRIRQGEVEVLTFVGLFISMSFLKKAFNYIKGDNNRNTEAALLATSMIVKYLGISESNPYIKFHNKYMKKNTSEIVRIIDKYSCDNEEQLINKILNDKEFINLIFVEPTIKYWFKMMFTRKLKFFHSQDVGSRSVNNGIYDGISSYLEYTLDNPNNTIINRIKNNFKSKDSQISSMTANISKKCNTENNVSESINLLIDNNLLILESDLLEENYFSKLKKRLTNFLGRTFRGNQTLKEVIFRVSDKLGLDYPVIEYLVKNIRSNVKDNSVRSTKRRVAQNNVSSFEISRIVAKGLALYMYDKTASPKVLNKLFKNKQLTEISNLFLIEGFKGNSSRDLIEDISTEINSEVDDIIQEVVKRK